MDPEPSPGRHVDSAREGELVSRFRADAAAFGGLARAIPRRLGPGEPSRAPTILPAPRWTALAAAAVIILSAAGIQTDPAPAVPSVRAASARSAILIRDGERQPLRPGTDLRPGDEIRVPAGGSAVVQIGAGEARLAGGAAVRIDVVSADRVILDQLAGRVFHRVVASSGQRYTVETAAIEWTSVGTAFDISRVAVDGGEHVTMAAFHHDVLLSGPGLRTTIDEGRLVDVLIGGLEIDLATGDIDDAAMADPWFAENARADLALGNPLGVLGRLEIPEAEPVAGR